jgi:hypothetical protein
MRPMRVDSMGKGGRAQRTFSQKYAYAAQTTKKPTEIAMKAVSFTGSPPGRVGAGRGRMGASSYPQQ